MRIKICQIPFEYWVSRDISVVNLINLLKNLDFDILFAMMGSLKNNQIWNMKNFQNLYEFIDKAVKNRKYPANTALGLKAALKLFEAEINEDERASVDKFKENLNQIYHGVSTNNKDITVSSLATYKSRVAKVIRDYELYGIDPTKMNNWSVKPIITRQKKNTTSSPDKNIPQKNDSETEFNVSANFVFDFRGGIKLIVPRNQKTSDAIADGELKTARQALTKFADEFMGEMASNLKQPEDDQD